MTNLFLFNLFMAPLFFVVSFIIADIMSSVNSFWQILSKGSETSRQFVRNVNIHSLLSAKSGLSQILCKVQTAIKQEVTRHLREKLPQWGQVPEIFIFI